MESEITRLLEAPRRYGTLISKASAPQNGTYTKERMPDGTEVGRSYNSRGVLTSEGWNTQDGGRVWRTLFESGQVKAFTWKQVDGTSTSVVVDSRGIFSARKDTFPNGDGVSWEYDDNGAVSQKWLIRKGQRPVPIH